MIYFIGMIIGIVYSICKFFLGIKTKTGLYVTCGIIMFVALLMGCAAPKSFGTILALGGVLCVVIICVIGDAESIENSADAKKKAIDEQKKQDKYDNDYGFIKRESKK